MPQGKFDRRERPHRSHHKHALIKPSLPQHARIAFPWPCDSAPPRTSSYRNSIIATALRMWRILGVSVLVTDLRKFDREDQEPHDRGDVEEAFEQPDVRHP